MISLFGGNYGLVASAPKPSAAPLEELGATGTPILSGSLRDAGEYNPDLVGISAFQTYEQMRRSDGQVAATLMAMKLPIRSAEWTVVEPADATPVEKEATRFVKQELLESIDLDAVIENALLMLDFGCAAHEDVWKVDGNRIRLKKLASRLPVTFSRWIVDANEELVALEQQGWRGDQYLTVEVPSTKLALFTYGQEGANFSGRSVMRPMYKHWFMKDGLYKIDAIACERNGMGVPTITMAASPKVEDRREARGWVSSLVAHEHTGLVLPPEWKFELVGVTGTLRDPKDSIAHHNTQISMAGLAQFMVLGQSESGNRALGQTMSDFFYMALQATANKVARVMSWSTIARLVDFNFSGVQRYPTLVPQQILSLRFETVVDALQKLGQQGFVAGDPEMEAWLREKMGAPDKPASAARPAAAAATEEVETDDGGEAASEGTSGAANAKSGDSSGAEAEVAGSDSVTDGDGAGSGKAAGPDFSGLKRAPRGVEKCLAASAIVGTLDQGQADVALALRQARSRIQAGVVQKLMARALQQAHQVALPLDEKLVAAVEAVLRRVYGFGREQVTEERRRQLGGAAPETAAEVRAAAPGGRRRAGDPVGLFADAVVSECQNDLTARAARITLDLRRRQGDQTDGEVFRRVEEELDGQSDKWIDNVASKGTNEAFAEGRSDGFDEYRDEIKGFYYSALLDLNTCENCARADGAEGATEDDIPDTPNPDCDGGDKCRCVKIAVFADEGTKA